MPHELVVGDQYELVVSTGGGLLRYRTGDLVRVTGQLESTPCLRFIGRQDGVVDLVGEKLHETMVQEIIDRVMGSNWRCFAILTADSHRDRPAYTLIVDHLKKPAAQIASEVEAGLRDNPHYAYARDLGQLAPLRVFLMEGAGEKAFLARRAKEGGRLGNIKPSALTSDEHWTQTLPGDYVSVDHHQMKAVVGGES